MTAAHLPPFVNPKEKAMTSLLIIAHGSRRNQANRSMQQLAKKVACHLPMNVDDVRVGFLEFSQPSVQSCIDACFNNGSHQVLVLPYFLANGNHVSKDIPNEIAAAKRKWPNKQIYLLPHIGEMEEMSSLIAKRCLETLINNLAFTPPQSSPKYYELEAIR
jgi:sirohydrochlorin ferrochelatase